MQESSAIRLRPARGDEAGEISDLVARAFAAYTPLIGQPPAPVLYDYGALVGTGRVTVAVEGAVEGAVGGAGILGMIYVYPEGDGAVMLDVLAVSQAARGRGLAKRLIAGAEAKARAQGAPLMRVYTNAVMAGPQAIYPRLGYRETHRGESDGYMRIHYEKTL